MEWLLWASVTASLGYTSIWVVQVHAARIQAQRIGQGAVTSNALPNDGTANLPRLGALSPPTKVRGEGEGSHDAAAVMGRLEIPAIGLMVPMVADFDPASLRRGVGHIQGTAMPGGLGTLGLAGHRDTFFRPLQRIAKDMDIRVTDESGTYHYRVDSTEIVTPDQVQVLDIRNEPKLTLVTCYPFDFIGQAPKRFIVHAHLLSLEPDEPVRVH